MNILIKLMSIVSLVIAPSLAQIHEKKAEVPVTPPVPQKETGRIEYKMNAEPIAKINTSNTVYYQ
jgi:K(+)-stimulated pyrophosphate-energized sodium pump